MTTAGLTTQLHRCGRLRRDPNAAPTDLILVCGRVATHRQTYRAVSGYAVETFRCEEHAVAADAPDHLSTTVNADGFLAVTA